MQIEILGCSGGIGGVHRTTALRVDDDILLDCGTGVGDLDEAALARIRHVFLSHPHMDHVACLPLLVDTLFSRLQDDPLIVHAVPGCLDILRSDIFNWRIWPDFLSLPNPDRPVMRFEPMEPGMRLDLDGRRIEMLPVRHTVPAAGYRIEHQGAAFAYSGDCTSNDELWAALNAHDRLDMLVVECAFSDDEADLARRSGHYCPGLLAADLEKLVHRPSIGVTHLKPGEEAKVMQELGRCMPDRELRRLSSGDVFRL
ncbi:3',5'-cyclic-nucleotide phosphodiesterase [Thioalkalivibrio denitrificans]|uniref:3',5'-cyclic-nucleotide phosphodiesterase n=1 Tax=Thioalkalivibrio denitrificans TaxID=108003 RepID=A0A1V3NBP3_9GAMM|nr:3',5'-cyclic-nucleotide phosphodiesterase [Thioalkalivibrio denitrificans]OOG22272.1 3',5'-cyclic-nucleotide phosphodiesterase [Thioalkalivibrio denitrificans]